MYDGCMLISREALRWCTDWEIATYKLQGGPDGKMPPITNLGSSLLHMEEVGANTEQAHERKSTLKTH